jgi:hypothetical protein
MTVPIIQRSVALLRVGMIRKVSDVKVGNSFNLHRGRDGETKVRKSSLHSRMLGFYVSEPRATV